MTRSHLMPPESVKCMTVLDRSKFSKDVAIPSISIKAIAMHAVLSVMKNYLLKVEKFKPIQNKENSLDEKIVYLNPDVVTDFSSLTDDVKKCLREIGITSDNLCYRNVNLHYGNWKAHEIISAVLPAPLSFSGYSTIGSIIHVNLKKELLPFKNIIGEVLLEKTKICKSVVNKTAKIHNTYRNFEMEVLAGSDDLKTTTKENGCRYELNFAEVYWNPRLHEEHGRVIGMLNEGDVLYDVCCGIGPFAIPAAKKRCEVLANDLNPACYEWLCHNAALNKVTNRITTYNKCGRDFIQKDLREDYLKRIRDEKYKESKFHIVMNLPATAYEFLPSFVKLFTTDDLSTVDEKNLPILHLYCFIDGKPDEGVKAQELVERKLNVSISDRIENICNVRNVAPTKEMFRVSFKFSKQILTGTFQNKRKSEGFEFDGSDKKIHCTRDVPDEEVMLCSQ